jgi:MFS family permease
MMASNQFEANRSQPSQTGAAMGWGHPIDTLSSTWACCSCRIWTARHDLNTMATLNPQPLQLQPAKQAVRESTYKWLVVAMLWFVCFFNYADRQAIYSVFPLLKKEYAFNEAQLGLIGSAFMWVYAGGAPLAGWICDRFRRKHLILGGCVFWSLITVMTGWCSKLWHFVAVRAAEGFGETFYYPASMSLISDYHTGRTRSRALSFHQSSVYIGTILGSWFGAWLAEKYNWRVAFYFFGTVGILLALSLYKFLREPRRGQSRDSDPAALASDPAPERILTTRETLHYIFRHPAVPLLMLAFLAANFVATIFLAWTPTFLVDKFHFKLSSAGLSGTVFIHAASACSVPLAGWLADKLSQRMWAGRLLVQGIGLAVGAGFVVLVGKTQTVSSLILAMACFGLCKGFYDSGIFASVFDLVPPEARGTAAGLMNTIGWGGGALGPLFVGLATTYGHSNNKVENMSDAIAFGGLIYLVGAIFVASAFVLARKWAAEGKLTTEITPD